MSNVSVNLQKIFDRIVSKEEPPQKISKTFAQKAEVFMF